MFSVLSLIAQFTEVTSFPAVPVLDYDLSYSSAVWGDYDNDGDLDLLMFGNNGSATKTFLIKNNGSDSFSDETSSLITAFPNVQFGDAAWGDYDNDGNIDLVITGWTGAGITSELFRNLGTGQFENNTTSAFVSTALMAMQNGTVEWVDYDNDGWLDLFIAGNSSFSASVPMSKLYRNKHDGTFEDVTSGAFGGNLAQVMYSASAWVDITKDGYKDLILTGEDGTTVQVIQVWKNMGDRTFADHTSDAGLDYDRFRMSYGTIAYGDLNNDGAADIILCGSSKSGSDLMLALQNDGTGAFTEITNPVAGGTPGPFSGLRNGNVALVDYNADGYMDIFFTGDYASSGKSGIFKNNGDMTFTADDPPGISNADYSQIAVADYNKDGLNDFILTGQAVASPFRTTQLFKNTGGTANTPPTIPLLVSSNTTNGITTLSWNASSDSESSANSLSYNLIVIDFNTGKIAYSSTTDYTNGYHKVPSQGNMGQNLSAQLHMVPGRYNAYLQAVDTALGVSAYSDVLQFIVPAPPLLTSPSNGAIDVEMPTVNLCWDPVPNATGYELQVANDILFTSIVVEVTNTTETCYPVENLNHDTVYFWRVLTRNSLGATSEWSETRSFTTEKIFNSVIVTGSPTMFNQPTNATMGDYDGDGDYDILISTDISAGIARTYLCSIDTKDSTSLGLNTTSPMVYLLRGEPSWCDYDNDGDLDALVTGYNTVGSVRETTLYRKDGALWLVFNNPVGAVSNFAQLDYSTSNWFDINNDGYQDLLLSGFDGTSYAFYEYIWDPNNTYFVLNTSTGLPSVSNQSVDSADIDNDGDIDLLITGLSGTPMAIMYVNDGAGHFTQGSILNAVTDADAAFGDYNNDGSVDVVIAGAQGMAPYTALYYNDGTGNFIQAPEASIKNMKEASVSWGDYDNDGDLDLLMCGNTNMSAPMLEMYVYTNDGTFSSMTGGLPLATGNQNGFAQWSDYNIDGRLDIVYNEINGIKVLRNNVAPFNSNPEAPGALSSTMIDTTTVQLNWSPSNDDHTIPEGLNYNIYIGKISGKGDRVSPMSHINGGTLPAGFRYVQQIGNAGLMTTKTVSGLEDGLYLWAVQAIDTAYLGSSFSSEQYFIVGTTSNVYLVRPSNEAENESPIQWMEWAAVSGAETYILEYIEVPADQIVPPVWANVASSVERISGIKNTKQWVRSTLKYDTRYYWRVGAVMKDKTIKWSSDAGGSGSWRFDTRQNGIRLEFAGVGLFNDTACLPKSGFQSEEYTFMVKYYHSGNELPVNSELEIYFDGWSKYLPMNEVDAADTTTIDGKLYELTIPDMRYLLTDSSTSDFYSENYIRYGFKFFDSLGVKVWEISPAPGTPIEQAKTQLYIKFINFRDVILSYNSVIRGTTNIIVPKVVLTTNESASLTVSPALDIPDGASTISQSNFALYPILMNPDHLSGWENDWCLVPGLEFTRFNFLTMAAAGTHTLSFEYRRAGVLITPLLSSEIAVLSIDTAEISAKKSLIVGGFSLQSDSEQPIRVIASPVGTGGFDVQFEQSLAEGLYATSNTPLTSKQAFYRKEGKNYIFAGIIKAPIAVSGTYVVKPDNDAPKLNGVTIKNGMISILATDALSGIYQYRITALSGVHTSVDGMFPSSILSEGSETVTIAVEDHVGNSVSISQVVSAGTIPKLLFNDKKIMNYPNPFNPNTTIEVRVESSQYVSVMIYNVKGALVKKLYEGYTTEGVLTRNWNGTDDNGRVLSSGVYYVKAAVGNKTSVHKIVLLK